VKRITIAFTLSLCLLAACSTKSTELPIAGLADMAQDAGMYHGLEPNVSLLAPDAQKAAYAHFLEEHFSPWQRTEPKFEVSKIFWGLNSYDPGELYGENTLPRSPAWMDQMREDSRVPQYPSMSRKAIAVVNTSMRAVPTNQPAFQDFSKAGEGYPFDYMQHSLVLAGTPLYATHISADRAWILVESRFAFGWVPVTDIGWVDNVFMTMFRTGTYAAITRDDVPITDTNGNYRFTGHVGTLLPVMEGDFNNGNLPVIIPARTVRGDAVPQVSFLPKAFIEQAPVPATPTNFTRVIDAMLGRQYGWGGMYEDRDCSAALMDLMVPFGIYLPRNSKEQIEFGTMAIMEGMSREQKKHFMNKTATPFLTLVGKPGHIMLYIGQKNGEPVIFHSAWGLKTKKNGKYGRRVIGGAVISTLEPGLNLPDLARPKGILLEYVNAISTLPEPQTK